MKQRIFQRLLMTAAVAGLLTVGAHAARRSVPVQVDADTLPVRGYVDSGVTYVPLRALLNGLDAGWRVWWDSSAGQAAAESEDDTLWADPAADTLTVNSRTFHGRVTVENGVTYVPLRAVCEALGCTVEWDAYLGGAAVTSPGAACNASELYWLAHIIYAESGAESMAGQIAVGNVILNRVATGRTRSSLSRWETDAFINHPPRLPWRRRGRRWRGKTSSVMLCISTPRRCRRGCGLTPTAPINRPSAATGFTSD